MGKNRTPDPPSPAAIAGAQAGADIASIRESAKINAIDQFAPWGSTTYDKGADGIPTAQRINLSPDSQAIFNAQQGVARQLGGTAGTIAGQLPQTPFRLSDLPSGDRVSNALYERSVNMMRPDMDEAANQLRVSLSERGIPIGSEIYANEMNRFDRQRNEAMSNAALSAVLAGGAEEDRLMNRALVERTQPMNELAAILQGSPAMPMPSFQSTPAYNVPSQPIGSYMMQDYQTRAANARAQNQSTMQGLFGLGSLLF